MGTTPGAARQDALLTEQMRESGTFPTSVDVERARMERPELYCPVCRRPTLISAGGGPLEATRRLARHLWAVHDPYFAALLRVALGAGPETAAETAQDPFNPAGEDW